MPLRDLSNLSISRNHYEMVCSLLGKFVPDAEVWAYGSRVNGDGHEASDLDLVVRNLFDPGLENSHLFDLKDAFVESNLPIRVDVMDWARIPVDFQNEIEKSYVVLQKGKEN